MDVARNKEGRKDYLSWMRNGTKTQMSEGDRAKSLGAVTPGWG